MAKNKTQELPQLYTGNVSVDDRGELGYINSLDLSKIKRFYTVKNHTPGFVRAWHGHWKEEKYFMVLSGSALIGVIKLRKNKTFLGGTDLDFHQGYHHVYPLTSTVPTVLYVPAGFANGIKLLTADTKIMVWSTATIEEARNDDYRYDAFLHHDLWEVVER